MNPDLDAAVAKIFETHVSLINLDGWLNLPPVRFNESNSAEHFYQPV